MNRTQSARGRAVAAADQEVMQSTERAVAQRREEERAPRRMNAVEAMANRCNVSEAELRQALADTVFKECKSEAQFIALAVVANEYQLNPLLKEIYAFPTGGGVTPMVSVDGWISLMNRHPAFDSIEFEYHVDDKGDVEAIESIIYRNDKVRPTKVIEYMDECKGDTKPWRKSPKRMLRHRALIQGVRVAFGFSGLATPDDDLIEGNYTIPDAAPAILPDKASFQGTAPAETAPAPSSGPAEFDAEAEAEYHRLLDGFDNAADLAAIQERREKWISMEGRFDRGQNEDIEQAFQEACERIGVDPATGEMVKRDSRGMTEVSEEEARALDAGPAPDEAEQEPSEQESPPADNPAWVGQIADIRKKLVAAKSVRAVDGIDRDWCNTIRNNVPNEAQVRSVDNDIAARRRALAEKKD